ncbi:hypothetical protein HPP92_027637, partial [Vanilla planifolia]
DQDQDRDRGSRISDRVDCDRDCDALPRISEHRDVTAISTVIVIVIMISDCGPVTVISDQ